MVEYGLLVGTIALIVGSGALLPGQDISTMFSHICSVLINIPFPG